MTNAAESARVPASINQAAKCILDWLLSLPVPYDNSPLAKEVDEIYEQVNKLTQPNLKVKV